MTVLHVAAGNAYGGIERMLVTLAGLAHPRLAQRFVVSFGGRLERELRASGAPVDCLPSPRAARPLMIWRARKAFAAVLEECDPAVTIFHGAWPHAMLAVVARAHGTRLGFWQHQPIARPRWPDRWAGRVRPDFVIYNSAYTRRCPAFPAVEGQVMYYPVAPPPLVDDATRAARRRELGAGGDDVVVLLAARLERWKGQTILLEAARRLPAASRIRIWLAGGAQSAGETAYYREVVEMAAADGLRARVSLLGQRDDVPLLARLADIYCQPNLQPEPFGISVAEAMLATLPCVISAGGGAAELLDASCGIVTAAGDVEAVAAALDALASDEPRRRAMGRAGERRAARLTDPVRQIDELSRLLEAHAG